MLFGQLLASCFAEYDNWRSKATTGAEQDSGHHFTVYPDMAEVRTNKMPRELNVPHAPAGYALG